MTKYVLLIFGTVDGNYKVYSKLYTGMVNTNDISEFLSYLCNIEENRDYVVEFLEYEVYALKETDELVDRGSL